MQRLLPMRLRYESIQQDRMTDRFYTVVGHSGLPQLTNKLIRHITCCTGGDV